MRLFVADASKERTENNSTRYLYEVIIIITTRIYLIDEQLRPELHPQRFPASYRWLAEPGLDMPRVHKHARNLVARLATWRPCDQRLMLADVVPRSTVLLLCISCAACCDVDAVADAGVCCPRLCCQNAHEDSSFSNSRSSTASASRSRVDVLAQVNSMPSAGNGPIKRARGPPCTTNTRARGNLQE